MILFGSEYETYQKLMGKRGGWGEGVTYKGTGKQIPNDIRKTINYEICRTKKFTEIINWWRGGSS